MTALTASGARTATIGRRVASYLVDQLPLLLASVLLVVLVSGAASAGSVGSAMTLLAAYPLVAVAYGVFLWGWLATRGLSPGKRVLRLRVVSADDGRPIGWGRAFLRQLVLGLILVGTAGIGGIVLLVVTSQDARRQGWHDKAAGSVVLDERGGTAPWPVDARPVERPVTGVVPVALPTSVPAPPPPPPPAADASVAPYSVGRVAEMPGGPSPAPEPVTAVLPVAVGGGGVISAVPGMVDSVPGADEHALPRAATVHAPPDRASVPVPDNDDEDDVGHTRLRPPRPSATGPWRLDLGGQRVVEVQGAGLIGRDPQPRPEEKVVHLVAVDDPQRSVSKTHLEFGIDGAGFWVRDRGSTNGSAVVTADGGRRPCPRDVPVHVPAGATLLVGDHEVLVHRS